ncbi:MAG TPA: Mth938-like domain-containing protein [Arenibaculum sp.]|nr:Mth938-like domain-containing protein [Arenibaculum sp.]
MDVTPIIPSDRQLIESYGDGQFRVSGVVFQGPVLVFPDHSAEWSVRTFEELSIEDFRPVVTAEPQVEILLLGSGPKMGLLPGRLRRELRAAGVVVDVMDTGAACRTYNILLSEARRVAAALLPV